MTDLEARRARQKEHELMEARLQVLEAEVGLVRDVRPGNNGATTFRTSQPTGSLRMPRHVEKARLAILEHEARLLAD